MSVIFTTFSNKYIALCADKQMTNINTGEKWNDATKIKQWTPEIVIGTAGNYAIGSRVCNIVRSFAEENGWDNYCIDDIADLLAQGYYALIDEEPDVPLSATTQFVVAGKRPNRQLCLYSITASNGEVYTDNHELNEVPSTLIFAPEDLSSEECDLLFKKAFDSIKNKYLKNPIESLHRRAIKNVSEHSKYVSSESDYIFITK